MVAEAPCSDYLDLRVPAAMSRDETVSVLDVNGPIVRTVTVSACARPDHGEVRPSELRRSPKRAR